MNAGGQKFRDAIIEFLPDATFVIDLDGKVIAWNSAMEMLTSIPAQLMLGKGNYEYALPFYKQRRPILVDLVFMPEVELEKKYENTNMRCDFYINGIYIENTVIGMYFTRETVGQQYYSF